MSTKGEQLVDQAAQNQRLMPKRAEPAAIINHADGYFETFS
jgi:hypothetical protein